MNPTFAVLKRMRAAAIVMLKKPGVPRTTLAESATGVRDAESTSDGRIPIMTMSMRV